MTSFTSKSILLTVFAVFSDDAWTIVNATTSVLSLKFVLQKCAIAVSLRSRRKHKAWGVSPRDRQTKKNTEPAAAGGSVPRKNPTENSRTQEGLLYRPLSRADGLMLTFPWGSAALHPRLYASACSAGWLKFFSEL